MARYSNLLNDTAFQNCNAQVCSCRAQMTHALLLREIIITKSSLIIDNHNTHISFALTQLGDALYICPARGRASVYQFFVRQVQCHGNAQLCSRVYCLHCGRLLLLSMPLRRLKEVAALTALHPAGMLESPGHAGKPGLSAASLCGKRHKTSLREEIIRYIEYISVQYR